MNRTVLVVLAAIAAVVLVVASSSLTTNPSRPPEVAEEGTNRASSPISRIEATSLSKCRIQGTVRRAGIGVPARLEVFLTQPGARGSRGPTSLPAMRWLTRALSEDRPVRSLPTDPDGRFRLGDLEPGEYRVSAGTTDGGIGFTRIDLAAPGSVAQADITVPSGPHTLWGRILTKGGQPCSALVWVVPGPRPSTTQKQLSGTVPVRTDDFGAFRIPGLDQGTVSVSVLIPSRLFTTFTGVGVPRDTALMLVVDDGFVDVKGQVLALADGSPIGNAKVSIHGQIEGRTSTAGAVTGSDGSFRLSVPEGEISISVAAGGFVPVRTKRRTGPDLEIRLARHAVVTGRVESALDGKPVPGVPVKACPVDTGQRSRMSTDTVSGPDGRFQMEAPPGVTMVYAFGEGWVSEELVGSLDPKQCPAGFVLSPGEEREVILRVNPAARAEGVVLDPAGTGVRGAVVWADRAGELARAPTTAPHRPSATTDDAGRFVIDTLVPGLPYRFSTRPAGHGRYRTEVHVADSERPLRLEIRLPETHWIEVRVIESGVPPTPIEGARVRLSGEDGEWRTDEHGVAFAGPVSAVKGRIRADHPDYVELPGPFPFELPADAENRPPLFVALDPAHRIRGRVVLPDGRPPSRVVILSRQARRISGGTISEEDGSFLLSRLSAGEHEVIAQGVDEGRSYLGTMKVRAGSEGVLVRLSEWGRWGESTTERAEILVRAVDREGNAVVGGRAALAGGFGGRDLAGGEARLFRPSSGEHRVIVTGARSRAGEHLAATLSEPVDTEPGVVTVVVGPGFAVSGRVLDGDGLAVPGIAVSILGRFRLPDGEATREAWHGRTRTARDGSFTLTGLGEAKYRLHLDLPSRYRLVEEIEIHPGEPPLTIRLEKAIAGILRVTDADGRPVGGARVEIWGQRSLPGGQFEMTGVRSPAPVTDPVGIHLFGPLDPDYRYDLRIVPPEDRSDLAELEVLGWEPADSTVRLAQGLPLAGRIRLVGGRSLPEMRVWCRPARGGNQSAEPEEDGRFSFANLPPGTVELGIWLDKIGLADRDRTIEVQAGRTDVVFEVDLGLPLYVEIENWPRGQREFLDYVWLIPESGIPATPDGIARARLGKRMRFEGLSANETYRIVIAGMDDGTCCVRTGIRAGDRPVRLRLVPGETIRGRLTIPPGQGRVSLYARSSFTSARGAVKPDGSFEIRGLTPGDWEVVAQAYGEGDTWSRGEATVAAGSEVDIRLEVRDD